MMFAKEEGFPSSRARLPRAFEPRSATLSSRQTAAGLDIVNDGEMSKPSYATYIKDRLTVSAARASRRRIPTWWPIPACIRRCTAIAGGPAGKCRDATRRSALAIARR